MSRTDSGISAGVSPSRGPSGSNAPRSNRCPAIQGGRTGCPRCRAQVPRPPRPAFAEVTANRALKQRGDSIALKPPQPKAPAVDVAGQGVQDSRQAAALRFDVAVHRHREQRRARLARIRCESSRTEGRSAHCRSSRTSSTGCRPIRGIHVSSDSKSRKRSASAATRGSAVAAPIRCAGSGHSRRFPRPGHPGHGAAVPRGRPARNRPVPHGTPDTGQGRARPSARKAPGPCRHARAAPTRR